MKNVYFDEGKVNIQSLRHDLQGLLMPFTTGLNCMKSGQETDGLHLQEQVLEKLKDIIKELNEPPENILPMRKE